MFFGAIASSPYASDQSPTQAVKPKEMPSYKKADSLPGTPYIPGQETPTDTDTIPDQIPTAPHPEATPAPSEMTAPKGELHLKDIGEDSLSRGCQELSLEEQAFAKSLKEPQHTIFCESFTSANRKQAMSMVGKRDKTGNIFTPNRAVSMIAKEQHLIETEPYSLPQEQPLINPKTQATTP
jgi:hypothetical protein